MFGQYTIRALMVVASVTGLAGFGVGRYTCHAPPPAPLTEPERAALQDEGFKPADEGPIQDQSPDLPGTPAGRITVTMPRRSPARGSGTVTESRPEGGGTTSEPGRSGVVPAAGDSNPPPTEGTVPAPIPAGLTGDDISGSAEVTIRQAGESLWTRADLTCCVGRDPDTDVCRTEVGAETEAQFDRSALCGQPRLPRLWTAGLGVALPDAEIVATAARWGAEKRLGWYGSLRYRLEADPSESVQLTGGEGYGYRVVTDQADRFRVEAGVVFRMAGK